MKRLFPLLVVLLALAGAWAGVQAQEPVTVVVQGPTAVAPGSTHLYTVLVAGGPAAVEGGTFEISYVVEGDNTVGADPQIPRILANTEGRFEFNVTAPEAEGTVQLFVRATSTGETTRLNETAQTRYLVNVFRPIELRATIRNNGGAAALNVDVRFYVDGAFVGNTTLARIGAGEQTEALVSFIPVNVGIGRHTVRVEADLDGDGTISPERGELIVTEFFYKSEDTNMPAILGTVTVFVLAFLVLILLAIRRQRRQG